jgi:hypothetical protein
VLVIATSVKTLESAAASFDAITPGRDDRMLPDVILLAEVLDVLEHDVLVVRAQSGHRVDEVLAAETRIALFDASGYVLQVGDVVRGETPHPVLLLGTLSSEWTNAREKSTR